MAKDWRIGLRDFGRSEDRDPLIRKSIVERRPGTTQIFFDKGGVGGFGLKITDKDHLSYVFQKRIPGRKHPKRWTLEARTVAAARAEASRLAQEHYTDIAERPITNPETVREVVDAYLASRGPNYRSRRAFEGSLRRHVFPALGDRRYEEVTRQDLARLQTEIIAKLSREAGQEAGRHAAHRALVNLQTVWSKFAKFHTSEGWAWPAWRSPLADLDNGGPGRTLSDTEIQQFWAATLKLPTHKGAWYRFLILTGMRRSSAARITREQIAPDWSQVAIPGSTRKPPYTLPLSEVAKRLLRDHFGEQWGFQPLGPYEVLKRDLDKLLGEGFAHWRNNDLRHTARSLLSRVATPDTAERCLGHSLGGLRRRYDHHTYETEKQKAMTALAALVFDIVK